MANSRYYSSIAQQTTLTGPIDNSIGTITVAASTGFPGSFPFILAVDYGSSNEELVLATAGGPTSYTVTRAYDGTSGTTHSAGAVVRHVSSAIDFTDSRTHEASTQNVHGVTGAGNNLVGTSSTQTLTNKTLDHATGTLRNIDVFNTGSFTMAIIGDSANPATPRLTIRDNEVGLNEMAAFLQNGALLLREQAAESSGAYKLRYLDNDGVTDRYALLAGGTTAISPDASTAFPAVDVVAPDTSTTKRAIRVAATGGGTERFTVWNDGRVDVVGTNTAFSTFDITGPASHASSYFRIIDGAANTVVSVSNTTKATLAGTADIKNDFHTGGVSTPVLRVFGRQPGQTGDLTQWVDPSNVIQARVDANGAASFLVEASASTSNVTAATGFSVVSFSSRKTAGVMTVSVTVQRTGSTITAGASGNIADTLCATLAAGFRPAGSNVYVTSYDKGGVADGSVSIGFDGLCTLKTLSPTADIASGDNITFNLTFVL